MNKWSRCRCCGAINDHDAVNCYLCGSSPLIHDCPACGAGFANPMDTECPRCGNHYKNEEDASTARKSSSGKNCNGHAREHYLERG